MNQLIMEGFLLIDKPQGITSHDVVDRVRRLTGEKRVGHAGTLDPFATGLLIVGVGRVATREMEKLVGLDKVYLATFVLGGTSDTDDRTGLIQQTLSPRIIERDEIEKVFSSFLGEIQQRPPAYSAIKIGGKKMYEAAREGKPLEAKPRTVTIHSIELLDQIDEHAFSLRIACSTGTYIRAIARDLGEQLGVGGYVGELRREQIGPFSIEEAKTLEELAQEEAQTSLILVEALLNRL